MEQHVLDQAYVRLLTLVSLRQASKVVEREARAVNIHINLDDIESVREHSQRKARDAMIDLVGDQIAAKFDMSPKAARARLADLQGLFGGRRPGGDPSRRWL